MTNYGHTSYMLLNKQVIYVAYKYVFINKTLQKEKKDKDMMISPRMVISEEE